MFQVRVNRGSKAKTVRLVLLQQQLVIKSEYLSLHNIYRP